MKEYYVTMLQTIKIPDDAEEVLNASGEVRGFKKDGKIVRFWFAYETEENNEVKDITFQNLIDMGFDLKDEEILIEEK